jgi:hypothetical protein
MTSDDELLRQDERRLEEWLEYKTQEITVGWVMPAGQGTWHHTDLDDDLIESICYGAERHLGKPESGLTWLEVYCSLHYLDPEDWRS